MSAIDLIVADLFPPDPTRARPSGNGKPKVRPKADRPAYPTPEAAIEATARKLGRPTARWTYHEADGAESFIVFRFDPPDDRKEFRPVHPTPEGWRIGDPPGPLPLYHLPELTGAGRLYATEGEKACDLARGLGLIATTSAHGSKSPHKSDWSPLAGREIVILPDADAPGESYAVAVAGLLAELRPRATVKVVRLGDLWRTDEPIPEGGDLAEWLTIGTPDGWTDEERRALLDHLADAAPPIGLDARPEPVPAPEARGAEPSPDWPAEPAPIRDELRPVPTLGPELVPEPFRGWLDDIAERVGCALDFPAVGALVAVAIVVGRKVGIRPKRYDDWTVVPNLWGGIVGRPGLLKTPALTEATKPVRRLEADARKCHEATLASFQAEALVAAAQKEAAKRDLKAAANGKKPRPILDDLARQLREADAPPEPTVRRYTTSDPTVEALGELLRDNDNGIGLVRDELTGWLRSFDRENRECDRAFYLEAWNGNGLSFNYDRVGRGNILIPNPCISILGGMQPGPLRSLVRRVARGDEADDGLISRFQLFVWPDPPAEWRNVDRWPDSAAKNRAFAIFQALDAVAPADIGAEPADDGDPPFLHFDPEAQEQFDGWRAALEAKVRVPDESPLIESHLAKYRSLMPSLAELFHLIAVVDGAGPGPVSFDAARLAVAWCDHLEAHARRIYACASEPDLDLARALADKIKAGALPSPFQARDAYRPRWARLDTPDAVRRAVAILEDLGWVRVVEIRNTGGSPREDIHLHPKLPRRSAAES